MKKLLALMLVLACLGTVVLASDVLLIAPNPNSAEASWTDGTDTVTGTLDEIMKTVNEKGGTVTLLKDIEMNDEKKSYVMTSDTSFTLDLNGHKIYSATRVLRITGKATGVTTVTDSVGGGAVMSEKINCNVEAGGIVLKNAIFWALTQQNIAYYDTTGNWNDVNLVENCTLVNSAWGAVAYNRTDGQSMANTSITYRNCALINAKMEGGVSIAVQTKAVGAKAVFEEGVMLCTYATHDSRVLASSLKYEGTLQRVTGKHTITLPNIDREYADINIWATEGADPTASAPGLPANYQPEVPAETEPPAEPETPKEEPAPKEDAVIGGADGPTSILVAKDTSAAGIVIGIAAAVVVLAAVVIVVVLKKKK